ncbi:S-adenosyl-L-methionine-dependent methyltransferase [Xylariales sp. AK1849]|nr:S-adenosyl-L-methionine-dependent methyltransferase [Xylariales sp. AK1849]
MPSADSASSGSNGSSQYANRSKNRELNFATKANEVINAALGRTPGGTSVVDPDSVLDDSGRLYHGYKDGAYFLPNDAAEQDRLDLQHRMFDIMLDGWLALAPMSIAPRHVLDIATGTGIWAMEFAGKQPSSSVIGTDLSAIQPDRDLPNCVFLKDDAEAPWLFPAPHPPGTVCSYPCQHNIQFDYIHLRMVCTCFDDTRGVVKQAYDNMAPGGWIEFQDFFCDTQHENNRDSALATWYDAVAAGAKIRGRDLKQPLKYQGWLEEAGFVDVVTRELVLPCSPWPRDPQLKEAGRWQLRNFLDGIQGVSWRMMTAAGYTGAEIEASIEATKKYLLTRGNRPFFWLYVVYGRKPLEGENQAAAPSEAAPTGLMSTLDVKDSA